MLVQLAQLRADLEDAGLPVSDDRPTTKELAAHSAAWHRKIGEVLALSDADRSLGVPLERRASVVLGNRFLLRTLRLRTGQTLEQAGEKLEPPVAVSTLSDLESGATRINLDRVLQLESWLIDRGQLDGAGELLRLMSALTRVLGRVDGPSDPIEIQAVVDHLLGPEKLKS